MQGCIFCKIATKQIPSKVVYEDEHIIAIHDLAPQAKIHVLILPKRHASDILEASQWQDLDLAALLKAVVPVSKITNVDQTGFRLVINTGMDAGQTVSHLHVHLMGGEPLSGSMA